MLKASMFFLIAGMLMIIGCQSVPDVTRLDDKMNQWHKDVATFNLDDYFGFMHDSFIFLGTAPGERWEKDAFYEFSKPYFEKKSTWDFKVIDRYWYYSKDKKIAWFEEDLETWMEDCRGSGVLVYEQDRWQLVHYNLTVLIENEKIQDFISLRQSEENILSSP
jgi:hypothetical protein